MSRRWLLSLLCLSLLFLSLVQLARARGQVRVDETNTRILLEKEPAEVLLAVQNSAGESLNTSVEVELLDPKDQSKSKTTQVQTIGTGNQTLRLSLPFAVSKFSDQERRQLLWFRLSYRISEVSAPSQTITAGIISLSEISPDLLAVRLSTSGLVREGSEFHARVQAFHPITFKPSENVRIDAEVSFEDDTVKLHAAKTTDARGYALLEFAVPPGLIKFPNSIDSSGDIYIKARKGTIAAEAKGEVMVDQLVRILVSTDKPLYQPGQVLHTRALLFTPSKRAIANKSVLITIKDPDEIAVSRTVVTSSRFGVVSADWQIPDNTRLGEYQVWVGLEGDHTTKHAIYTVRISRYELPNFTVTVDPDRKYYLPGQNADVKVRADYLFGKPVTRGRVRVVRETERDWNYREQKWDIKEGDSHEGETDANGSFVAHLNLASDHEEVSDSDYRRFRDVTYAAYFTDPTTNRTEQRRFDLRVTKEAIHIYVIKPDYDWAENRKLPLRFYVSTFYADGSPARCKVNVNVANSNDYAQQPEIIRPLKSLRTNRYGLAKLSDVRLPSEFEDERDIDLIVSATDANGRSGSAKEDFSLDNEPSFQVETDKTLYRAGEPLTARIRSSIENEAIVVDLVRDGSVIRSERVKLRDGRGLVVFPYTRDFKNQLTIAAYTESPNREGAVGTRTVLYPHSVDLKVKLQTSQKIYRPGENAHVNLRVHAPEGRTPESALGLVVLDKAVEERFRTDQESGRSYYSQLDQLQYFLGLADQLAGVSLRDLQSFDTSRFVPPELDLLAEILLNRNSDYRPSFYQSEHYETNQQLVFGDSIKQQLSPFRDALTDRYARTAEYPKDESRLRRILLEAQLDLNAVLDPWGTAYRPAFALDGPSDELRFISAGADKRFGTNDDFVADRVGWPYFRPIGQLIDKAVRRYHERTPGFIRDMRTLREELLRDGMFLDQIRDPWGEPYRFEFEISESNFVIKISSGGPNRRFSGDRYFPEDDFVIWNSALDYFARARAEISNALNQNLQSPKRFPQNDQELGEALQNLRESIDALRDPWNRPYYRVFKTESVYTDRVRLENRASFGLTPTTRTEITPVTQVIAFVILRSVGADGKAGTVDDFTVGTFTGVISEQERGRQREVTIPAVVLSPTSGAVSGLVTDVNGAIISGVVVSATRLPDGPNYNASTNDEGKYSISGLPPGIYELRFNVAGFTTTVVTDVVVHPSRVTEVNASLQPGQVTETVTVTAAAPSMQTQAATVSNSITVAGGTNAGRSRAASTPRLREYFPETLIWQPSLETDKRGRAQINFKLADTITTWKMAVVGSTEDGLIGATETEIKAFQPFFVDHDPPRVLTEGDQISLPVVVRNYLEQAQRVDLEIKSENWFSLLGPARKSTAVNAGDATRETFDFRATSSIKDGKQRITATAVDGNDAIERPVTVHPDGEDRSTTAADILGSSAVLELNVPENVIPNSSRGELKIYPNLMAHVAESVEAIMVRPYGCGEQAISSTYPSLLLLRHYKQRGEEFPLRARAQHYLKDGYSRLLNYRHESGGFTYWGRGEPDVALTAYALRFLVDAADVISVDEDVISGARQWVIKQQRMDGSWKANRWWSNVEDTRGNALLTAYVTRVLSMNEEGLRQADAGAKTSTEIEVSLKRALDYLSERAGEIDEPHLLASYALAALSQRDVARVRPIVDKLRSLAHQEGTKTYWSLETNTPFYGWGLAGRVETTALVVQALTRYCAGQTANCDENTKLTNRALLFLLKQKDSYGVWYSTQATINVLDALLSVMSINSSSSASASSAEIVINDRVVQTIQMPAHDLLSIPITSDISQFLHTGKNRIEIKRPSGSPSASVHALVNYYVPWSASDATDLNDLRLVARFNKTEGKINDEITCHVEAERVGFRGYGMMLAEIGLPPGADVDRKSLETAMKGSGWAISQYDVLPDRVVVYLWPKAGGVKFDFKFRPRFGLTAKTASSVVYDYYNPESRAVLAPSLFRVK